MIHFFSNHTDTEFLSQHTGEEIQLIRHPYIDPSWSEAETLAECATVMLQAINAEKLIINGDYFIVAHIVIARKAQERPTGFISFEKSIHPDRQTRKDDSGNINYQNTLKPVGIKWIK